MDQPPDRGGGIALIAYRRVTPPITDEGSLAKRSEKGRLFGLRFSNTYYYEWRAKGQTTLKSSDKIHFMVWDKDKVDSDLMGECITDTIAKIPLGKDIVLRNCGQVDFIAFKITKK